jgi:uncharacterized DUF497 family protein
VSPAGFEWDPAKAQRNLRVHGVSFEEAATVFAEWGAPVSDDPLHSEGEDRFIIVGTSELDRLLTVAFTYRGDEIVRIISARSSTPHEKRVYEKAKRFL